jgi:hypothetical protein
MLQKFTTVNINQEWFDIFFKTSKDSITYKVLNLFISGLTTELDSSKIEEELLPYYTLQFNEFKSQYKAKKDSSTRISLLPSLIYLLEEDQSELGKFIMALHNYKLNKVATSFSNRLLNLLFLKECKIIDKYRSDVIKTESFGIELDEVDPITEIFVEAHEEEEEHLKSVSEQLNDITGSVEIRNTATQEEIEEAIKAVQFEDEEIADDELGMMYNEDRQSKEVGRAYKTIKPGLNPYSPEITDDFFDEDPKPVKEDKKKPATEVFKSSAQTRGLSAVEIFQQTVKNTEQPRMDQLKHIAQIEENMSATQRAQEKRETEYKHSPHGAVPKSWVSLFED